jgi:hypothetical protein
MDDNEYSEKNLADMAGIIEVEKRIHKEMAAYDDFYNLLFLLHKINEFEPREEWILRILKETQYLDFKNQLLTALEDYKTRGNPV